MMYRLISIALYLHFIKKATDRDRDMNFVFLPSSRRFPLLRPFVERRDSEENATILMIDAANQPFPCFD